MNRTIPNKRLAWGITLCDITDEADVSYTANSYLLNNKSGGDAATREHILCALAPRNYVSNIPIRSLVQESAHAVGSLVNGLMLIVLHHRKAPMKTLYPRRYSPVTIDHWEYDQNILPATTTNKKRVYGSWHDGSSLRALFAPGR